MKIIKKKISLLSMRNYTHNGYGGLKSRYLYFDVFLDHTFDLIGLFGLDDMNYECENCTSPPQYQYNPITDKDKRVSNNPFDYYHHGNRINATIDSRLDNYKTYRLNNPYQVNFDIKTDNYINYQGVNINGSSRITSQSNDDTIYTIDGNNDSNLGTDNQLSGLLYKTNRFSGTTVEFNAEGVNMLNTQILGLYRKDEDFGLIWPTEIYSDIFINRSRFNITERITRLSEINTTDDLRTYYNGYYKILTNGI